MNINDNATAVSGNEDPKIPSVAEVLADPSISYWLKKALATGIERDCVDAAHDAELLSRVLNARADAILKGGAL